MSITDIGSNANLSDAGSTLVCMTSNVNTKCCRNSDGGRVGEWFYPNGTKVPRNFGTPADDIFTRSGYTEQVRLNRQANAVGPLGVYRCDVPAEPPGAIISASIMIGGDVLTPRKLYSNILLSHPPPTTSTKVPATATQLIHHSVSLRSSYHFQQQQQQQHPSLLPSL